QLRQLLDRVVALEAGHHYRSGGHVGHQVIEERLALMLRVEFLALLAGELSQPRLGDAKTLALDMSEDLADQLPVHGVGLDDEQRTFLTHVQSSWNSSASRGALAPQRQIVITRGAGRPRAASRRAAAPRSSACRSCPASRRRGAWRKPPPCRASFVNRQRGLAPHSACSRAFEPLLPPRAGAAVPATRAPAPESRRECAPPGRSPPRTPPSSRR